VLLPLLWIAFIVGGLAWTFLFARVIRRPQQSHAAGRSAHGADNLTDTLFEAVRRVTKTAKQRVQQRKSRY
jgi:hypothetical protein